MDASDKRQKKCDGSGNSNIKLNLIERRSL